ncbi:MAG: laccase domain-containing protein [Eubacteriaceae bacterium]|jgi:copper oxidase (laccase) domain-containing protein|nr:laccase domain-containing protein [Eubacteriaceae bacterium]
MIIDTKYRELFVFCSTVEDGDMSGTCDSRGGEHFTTFREKTGLAKMPLYFFHILHADKITKYPLTRAYHREESTKSWPFLSDDWFIDTDALITHQKGTYFAIGFGDCNPVIIYDHVKQRLAFGHCGWRSTVMNLHLKMADALTEAYGSRPEDMAVIFGPAIRPQSYGFANEPDQLHDPAWKEHITFADGLYHIDLAGYMADSLEQKGIAASEITMPFANTYEDPRFYSHYRAREKGDPDGRFIFGAGIRSKEDVLP